MQTNKFKIFKFLTLAILVIKFTSCCKQNQKDQYFNKISISTELKGYFGVYDTVGTKWVFQNTSKTQTDTFSVFKIIDTTILTVNTASNSSKSNCKPTTYNDQKGFKIKSTLMGEISALYNFQNFITLTDSQKDTLLSCNINSDSLYINSITFTKPSNSVQSVTINDTVYKGTVFIKSELYNNRNRFYIQKGLGIIAYTLQSDTFNLIKKIK